MAGNYWASSHCKRWILKRDDWNDVVQGQAAHLTPDQVWALHEVYADVIQDIGNQCSARQRVIATAIVYWKRFYVKRSLAEHRSYCLVAATSLLVAMKVEEALMSNKAAEAICYALVTVDGSRSESNGWRLLPEKPERKSEFASRYSSDMHRYEFKLLTALNFDLIVYHPYDDVSRLLADAKESLCLASPLPVCIRRAWGLVNDTYRSNVCLLFDPHVIALAAVYLTGAAEKHSSDVDPPPESECPVSGKLEAWLKDMNVDFVAQLGSAMDAMVAAYERTPGINVLLDTYNRSCDGFVAHKDTI